MTADCFAARQLPPNPDQYLRYEKRGDDFMAQQIIYPTFKDAQQLYDKYSTIENVTILSRTLHQFIDSSFLSTMRGKNIHEIYNNIILKYYPNEICIKSGFINQVLMTGKKHVTIFELPVGSSRADLCKINGKSIAYEIKTDLDNFSRLHKQIADYNEIFEEVYVICSSTKLASVLELLPAECGVYTYTQSRYGNYKFRLYRKALVNTQLNPVRQLQLLRKSELQTCFPVDAAVDCSRPERILKIVQKYSNAQINHGFKVLLKQRFQKQWTFLVQNHNDIYEIDYQWFYKNQIAPHRIYQS